MREVWAQGEEEAEEEAARKGRAGKRHGGCPSLGRASPFSSFMLSCWSALNAWSLTSVGGHDASARQVLACPRAIPLRAKATRSIPALSVVGAALSLQPTRIGFLEN